MLPLKEALELFESWGSIFRLLSRQPGSQILSPSTAAALLCTVSNPPKGYSDRS